MIALIFALIGIIVSAFVGVYFVQKVANTHLHVLQKQSMARDYVVMDMAPPGEWDVELASYPTSSEHSPMNQEYGKTGRLSERESLYLSGEQQMELDRLGLR